MLCIRYKCYSALVRIAEAVVALRRSEHGKGWLTIEVTKTQAALTKLHREQGRLEEEAAGGDPDGGTPDEKRRDEACITGLVDDTDHEYQYHTEEEIEQKVLDAI